MMHFDLPPEPAPDHRLAPRDEMRLRELCDLQPRAGLAPREVSELLDLIEEAKG